MASGEGTSAAKTPGSSITVPVFPLTRDQFADALAKGLGRAHLHIARHGAAGFEDILLDACLHNRAYDPQCENDRAPWMAELVAAAGLEEKVLPALICGLQSISTAEAWDPLHRCSLAARFAARGHTAAREALYDAFRKSVDADDPVGAHEIVDLDGAAGLIAVADAFGQRLLTNPALRVGDWCRLYRSDEEAGPAYGRAILEQAAIDNAAIRRFLDRVPPLEDKRREPRPPRPLAEVLAAIDDPSSPLRRFHLGFWGRHATEDDLRVIADRLRAAHETKSLRVCLTCFTRRPYPPLLSDFLALAEHTDPDVRDAAVAALSPNAHADVRALALRRIEAGQVSDGEIRLLTNNYASGDEDRIARALAVVPADPDARHSLAMDVCKVFEANPSAAARTCMLWVCEHTPCSLCRADAVRVLFVQGDAPPWLVEEGHFDADSDTRALCSGTPTQRPR